MQDEAGAGTNTILKQLLQEYEQSWLDPAIGEALVGYVATR